jgi:hypothetical protein
MYVLGLAKIGITNNPDNNLELPASNRPTFISLSSPVSSIITAASLVSNKRKQPLQGTTRTHHSKNKFCLFPRQNYV